MSDKRTTGLEQHHAEVWVDIEFREESDAVTRVTGPGGDEWRAHLYDLKTYDDVLDHWTYNCIYNGVRDVSQLDGWADLPEGTVTLRISHVETKGSVL